MVLAGSFRRGIRSLAGPLDHYGYWAIALLLLLENIGVPVIPGEFAMIAGAIFAGTGQSGPPVPGPAASSTLNNPAGVAVDPFGNLFIADGQNYRIRKIGLALSVPSAPAILSGVNVYPNPTHDRIEILCQMRF